MATANQNAQGLVLALFNASAGGNLANLAPLATTASAANSLGANLVAVAALVTGKNLSDNTTFRDTLLSNLQITTTSAAYANAKAWVDGQLATPGTDKGSIAGTAVTYLLSLTDATNPYYAAASKFQARNDAAVTWSTSAAGSAVLSATALIAQQASVDNYVAPPPPPVGITTVALTTSTTDAIVAGTGDDSITGVVSSLASANTLDTTDKIDGGTGNNTLTLNMGASWNGFTAGNVKNITAVALTNTGTTDLTFNALNLATPTAFSVTGTTGSINLTNISSGVKTISLSGLSGSSAQVAFTTGFVSGAAEETGTSDTVSLNLASVGLAAVGTTKKDTSLNLAKFETVNITASGNNFVTLAGTDATKVTVAGAGNVTVIGLGASNPLANFDAGASTGNITADLSASASNTLASVIAGSGTDSITIERANTKANATLSGGAGATDKLTLKSASSGSAEYVMSGFETLALNNTSGTLTLSGSKTTGLQTVTILGGSTAATRTDGDVQLVNMPAGDLTFTSTGPTANQTLSSDHVGATTLNINAAAATITAASSSESPTYNYSFSAATGPLTVNVGAFVDTTTGAATQITGTKASALILNVASGQSASGTELTVFDQIISVPVATAITVNSTGQLTNGSTATIQAAKATTATIVNGASAGTLVLTTPLLASLNLTTANTFNFSTSDLSKVQTLTIADSKGTTTVPDTVYAATVNLSGAGSSSKVALGKVGGDNNYDLTLTATGLNGGTTAASAQDGLTITDLTVGSGYSINADFTGIKGGVNIANVLGDSAVGTATTVAQAKNVSINAAGLGGTLALSNIVATGNVTVLANGAGGATIGNITGDNIKVDASSTANISTVGTTITAKTSVDLTVHGLATGATYTVSPVSGSTGLNINFNGGLNNDNLVLNGNTTTANLTVTGNFGAGTDTIQVTGNSSLAKTINISGATGYETSLIFGGVGIDTITGGAGNDVIHPGLAGGGDTITTGAGNDVVWIDTVSDSPIGKFITISDLSSTDRIAFGFATAAMVTTPVTSSTTRAAISALGVATFSGVTAATSLAEKVSAVNAAISTAGQTALFSFNGDTYLFGDTDSASTANTTGVLVKLVGVTIPTATAAAYATGTDNLTGLVGFGQ